VGRRLKRLAHFILNPALDFIYPPFCLCCKSRLGPGEQFVCESCWSFDIVASPKLPARQLEVLHGKSIYFDQSIAIYEFSEKIQDLIHIMKYKAMPGICTRFGQDLGVLIQQHELLKSIDYIAPVPLHSLRQRERGYNQAGLMAREIGALAHINLDEKLLKRSRYTNQQAKFNKEERAVNVQNAFALGTETALKNKSIAIVDDVLTTGSTMNECAKILKDNGASHVVTISIVRI
jgi:ComF family protein